MSDWSIILREIAPRASSHVLDEIVPHIDAAFTRVEITTPLRAAHFLARAAVETDSFTTLEERGGAAYFKRYDGRRDLGNIYPGDGARFHGRGVFQITGRANYHAYGPRVGADLVKDPDLAAQGEAALLIGVLFWGDKDLNAAADRDDVLTVCKRINGGTSGLGDQRLYLARAKAALAASESPGPLGGVGSPAADEPLPREQVRALQQRLDDLGYLMVGAADGLVGSSTVAAISAFQHDRQLEITGAFDAATIAAIWASDEPRPLPTSRTQGVPADTRILAPAQQLKAGAGLVGAGGLASVASGALDQADAAKGYWERLHTFADPARALSNFAASHVAFAAIAAALVVGVLAWRIAAARIEDHRTGRTP